MKKLMSKVLIYIITGYQYLISPNLPKACRFYPTCSEYAKEALLTHGLRNGLLQSLKRILRCNPFCHGGYDPVPPKEIRNSKFEIFGIDAELIE